MYRSISTRSGYSIRPRQPCENRTHEVAGNRAALPVLVQISPGTGSLVGRAVARTQAGNPTAGLDALDAIPSNSVLNYQPYWAARGHLLHMLGRSGDARKAWGRAAALTDDPSLREYLARRAAEAK